MSLNTLFWRNLWCHYLFFIKSFTKSWIIHRLSMPQFIAKCQSIYSLSFILLLSYMVLYSELLKVNISYIWFRNTFSNNKNRHHTPKYADPFLGTNAVPSLVYLVRSNLLLTTEPAAFSREARSSRMEWTGKLKSLF